jgi:hypothetical protein
MGMVGKPVTGDVTGERRKDQFYLKMPQMQLIKVKAHF